MTEIQCRIASTLREFDEAARVRWQVFGEEERLLSGARLVTGREVDAFDTLGSTTHFVVYAGDEPVAVARLLRENPDVARAQGTRLGVPLEEQCRIVRGFGSGCHVAEVSRLAVRAQWRCDRRVLHALFGGIYVESRRQGLTHLLGVSNAHTDSLEDANLAYQVASRRGLLRSDWRLEPSGDNVPETPPRRLWYSPAQRQLALSGEHGRLPLPPTLSLVVKRARARIAGGPIYEPPFASYALPIVVELMAIESIMPPFTPSSPLAPSAVRPVNHAVNT